MNCDGAVDVSDAVLLARLTAADSGAVVSQQGKQNGDCNQDGKLTGSETIWILKVIANSDE